MSRLLYAFALSFYHNGIRLAAYFSPKAKAWVDGRKNWQKALLNWKNQQPEGSQILWMHCASLGEFEQGRPVLEEIRDQYPGYKIVLSFYSPSGYLQQKKYNQADYVCYLPTDTSSNAQFWVQNLSPSIAIFVKYEFWYFHLSALFEAAVPCFLIGASFRPEQIFFQPYGGFFKKLLKQFKHIFVQQQQHLNLLQEHGITAVSVAGDPRVDRVLKITAQTIEYRKIATFKGASKLFIAGSSWPAGEDMLLQKQDLWWTGQWKLLLAPHDVSDKHIEEIISKISIPYCRYSQLTEDSDLGSCRILILDTIGMLSSVYRYGDLTYIGGGFGKSIHNTLEPAAYGLPILYGPRHEKFPEAVSLAVKGGGFVVETTDEFEAIFQQLSVLTNRQQASQAVRKYINSKQGATQKILENLVEQKVLQ